MAVFDLAPLAPMFAQVSYVVRDLDKACERYQRALGIDFGPFRVALGPDRFKLRGKPASLEIAAAIGMMGNIEIELIQPIAGATDIFVEHLERHGSEVAHHLGYKVPDFDAYFSRFARQGFEALHHAYSRARDEADLDSGIYDAAYFDLRPAGLTIVEISQVKRYPAGDRRRKA